jgi:Transposase IS66 family
LGGVGLKRNTDPLTPGLVNEAEILLKRVKKRKDLNWLGPVVTVADYFIRSLSKRMRAEPDQVGCYDKRYVGQLQGKVFGTGRTESGRSDMLTAEIPTLKEAQDQAMLSDSELKELIAKRDVLRKELKEYTVLIRKRRSVVRKKVKKGGKWRADERLFHSPVFRVTQLGEIRKVGRDVLEKVFKKFIGFHRTNDRVKRMRLKMELEEVTYTVETVTDLETGVSVRASMDDVGPPDSNLTWSALANVLKLHIEYVIPMNRIAAMLGHAYFSTANQCRWIAETAWDLLPIYVELFNQLADSPLWQGDDTTTKVLDITPSKHEGALHKKVEEELPFGFNLKNGQGKKSKLNVTFITGRTGNDVRGTIRFYRTHLGSFGNLVSELLSRRSPKSFKDVIIQGDLSTTNLPLAIFSEKFNIKMAGCGSHARRPYWEERTRIDAAYFFLRGFELLSHIEEDHGKIRFENPAALRKRTKYSRWIWAILRRGSLTVMNQKRESSGVLISYDPVYWPKDSKFYLACQYIVKHYDELTLYLKYPELEWTNNLSERAQRKEKLMLNSSFFRKSREGRVALDILKTVMATAQAAQINLEDYLQFVILNKEDVQINPHLYTPLAFAQKSDKKVALVKEAIA